MDILEIMNGIVWGLPTLSLILFVGLYLSVQTGFAQLRLLPNALKAFCSRFQSGGSKSFQALCTALAATVGTGNIAGVAGAIAIGGPGSIFWMWICAIFGMIIKFAEALLAVRYRVKDEQGNYCGGPMHIIESGLGKSWHPMAMCYCFLGVAAAFGVGNATQVNAVVGSANMAIEFLGGQETKLGNLIIGAVLAALAAAVFLGGFKRIGSVTELLVPAVSAAYIVLCVGALIHNLIEIPKAIHMIVAGAFTPSAVTGGAIGSAFTVLRIGTARGVFTNEAGMGTAAIAHGTANVQHPAEQGLMGIIEVFLDTVVICTMTALVILTSGVEIPYGTDTGAVLTTQAFSCTYGQWVSVPIALFLTCFAFATILGWGYYGLECAKFLLGNSAIKIFILLQAATAVISTVMRTGDVWLLAELFNGLMAIPNLITLALLSGTVTDLTRDFIRAEHRTRASDKNLPEGNRWRHARFHERGSPESFHR